MTTNFPVSDAAATAALATIGSKMPAIHADGGAMFHITNIAQLGGGQVASDWNATSGVNQILNKPTIPAAQVESDWNATTGLGVILNKPTIPTLPTLAAVATSGQYSDLSGKPTIPTIPSLAAVATSGQYSDLSGKPTIPAAQVEPDWLATTGLGVILNKPTIPAAQVQSDWLASTGAAAILNKPTIPTVPTLAAVATSGQYSDLAGKPTIPAAQVQSDWNATTGLGVVLNKPVTLVNLILDWVYSNSFAVLTATRNSDEVVTSASIVFPDGGTGTFTADTLSTLFPGAIDAYHVTYSNAGTNKTITQTAVTRDANGAVIAQPVLTIV